MARMDRCQIQVTCTSWIQSSCTIFRTFVILSRGTAEIICFLQHRCVQAFLCATHLGRWERKLSRVLLLRQRSVYTFKGAKACCVLELCSTTGAIPECEPP